MLLSAIMHSGVLLDLCVQLWVVNISVIHLEKLYHLKIRVQKMKKQAVVVQV